MKQEEKLTDKPRTLAELSAAYNVSKVTFKEWLKCDSLKPVLSKTGNYFTVKQVRKIVEHLGEPR